MAPYQHLPLIKERIRLLQLLPDPDPHDSRKPIRCRLFEHALLTSTSIHPFDALSYAWGSDDKPHTILIDHCDYGIGTNLHAALLHLRDRFIERYLWIDAICINQADNVEKGHQVQSMARIYSMATRVIVWLGEATANGSSNRGLEEIRLAAGRKDAEANEPDLMDEEVPDGVLDLLGRPWFERVWVLQEAAAARQVLIKCGHAELDGYAFSIGVEALGKRISQERNTLYSLVSSLNGLIRGAIIRPRQHHHDQSGRPFSLSVRPLSGLLDIFRSRQATKTVDKVYALLGMSSDDPDTVGLSGDYNASWDAVSKKVVRFYLSNQVTSIETIYGLEAIVIKAKTKILGRVGRFMCQLHGPSTTRSCRHNHDLYMPYRAGDSENHEMTFTGKQNTLAATQDEDLVCLFQGASYPSIIRQHHDYWTVIIVAMRPSGGWYPDRFQSDDDFAYELLLVWDWSNQQPVEGLFEDFIRQRLAIPIDHEESLLGPMSRNLNTNSDLAKLTRLIDTAIIFEKWAPGIDQGKNLIIALAIFDSELGDAHATDMKSNHSESARSTRTAEVFTRSYPEPEGEERLLRLAIGNGYDAASQHFVNKGVDINSQDYRGDTPLHLAAQRGSQAIIIKLLLDRGADIERSNRYGETPLCCALKGGHEVIARMLCDKGADINGHPGGVIPLMSAAGAKQGGQVSVRFLLGKGATVNDTDKKGNTALHYCAFYGKATTLQVLLDQGAAIDHRNQYHLTPLFFAVIRGNKAMVKRLLEYGADLEATSGIGQTPLVMAIRMRRRRIVRILLDNGASFDTTEKYGETPLHLAVRSKVDETRKWPSRYHRILGSHLRKMRFGNPVGTEEDGWEIVQMILERGADTEARSRGGCTPLHFAACVASAGLMKLIKFGANVNGRDDMGQTPLMMAVIAGLEDNVRLLLSSGSDVDAEDANGDTALVKARGIINMRGVLALLESHAANTKTTG